MPVTIPSYRIVVVTAPSDTEAKNNAERLGAEIHARARSAGARRAHIEITQDSSFLSNLLGPNDPNTVAVVLANGPDCRDDSAILGAAEECLKNFIPILPVFNPNKGVFTSQIPPILHRINGLPWGTDENIVDVALAILKFCGITEEDQRIFLSYRQIDGLKVAEQLRTALIDLGWDVFLDRFSIPPGVDFQKRLDRELSEKSFVLLLETPRATESEWVEHEIAFALERKLGLLALTSPSTSADQLYPAIHDSMRLELGRGDFEDEELTSLTLSALNKVMHTIDETHAAATSFRRQSAMLETSEEMRALGYSVTTVDHWGLLGTKGTAREVALVTVRAPEAADLRKVDRLRRQNRTPGSTTRGWVVHPTEDVDIDRAALLDWLSQHRRISSTPLMLLADRIQS